MNLTNFLYFGPPIIIFFAGLFGIFIRKKIIHKIIALDVMSTAVVLFFVVSAKFVGNNPPIYEGDEIKYADPVAQSVIITSIVVWFATLTLSIALIAMIVERIKKDTSHDLEKEMED